MFQFILTNIFMISLGTVLYLVSRSLPRLGEEEVPQKQGVLERLVTSEIPEKVDALLGTYSGKFVRKLKIYLLRLDNYLTEKLKRGNTEGNGKGTPKIDFKEISGEASDSSTGGGSVKK